MQGSKRFALPPAPGFLLIGFVSFGTPCVAQDGEVEGHSLGGGRGSTPGSPSGSVFAPSGYFMVTVPVQKQIDLSLLGFYIGELDVPVGQLDVPTRLTKFLMITPSYMYYTVPASGLNKIAPLPGGYPDSYEEHQARIGATLTFSIRKFEINARHMYVRRFRPAPAEDSNRHRDRVGITYLLPVQGRTWRPFAQYEAYHEEDVGWNRDRIWIGVTLPFQKMVSLQPSYMWESADGTKDTHYMFFALIINLR